MQMFWLLSLTLMLKTSTSAVIAEDCLSSDLDFICTHLQDCFEFRGNEIAYICENLTNPPTAGNTRYAASSETPTPSRGGILTYRTLRTGRVTGMMTGRTGDQLTALATVSPPYLQKVRVFNSQWNQLCNIFKTVDIFMTIYSYYVRIIILHTLSWTDNLYF